VDRDELHARIRRLIFASPALSEAFTRGEFRSVFKGRGVDFESLREYDDSDDARLIDWNVSVRLAKPYVRLYREDRSLSLFLIVDLSPSMDSGSGEVSKRDMAILAASLLAYAAQLRAMPVGALLFSGTSLRYFEPRRGKAHALAISDAAVELDRDAVAGPRGANSPGGLALGAADGDIPGDRDLGEALDAVSRLLKRRSLIMALSDFAVADYDEPLAQLARRHDLVAMRITDRIDTELPASGGFFLRDAEGQARLRFPLENRRLRQRWKAWGEAEIERCRASCIRARVPLLELDSSEDPARALLEFFDRRRRRP
jgi:uncharacterized protein (DUF58 family)